MLNFKLFILKAIIKILKKFYPEVSQILVQGSWNYVLYIEEQKYQLTRELEKKVEESRLSDMTDAEFLAFLEPLEENLNQKFIEFDKKLHFRNEIINQLN